MTVKIDFEIEREGLVFRDALILADDYADDLSWADIAAMKEERFTAWRECVAAMAEEAEANS